MNEISCAARIHARAQPVAETDSIELTIYVERTTTGCLDCDLGGATERTKSPGYYEDNNDCATAREGRGLEKGIAEAGVLSYIGPRAEGRLK